MAIPVRLMGFVVVVVAAAAVGVVVVPSTLQPP